MRFHLLGLPYTVTNKGWPECAYTQRIINVAKVMTARGHEVIHYGSEGAELDAECVTIMSRAEQIRLCGTDRQKERTLSRPHYWQQESRLWKMWNGLCIGAIMGRVEHKDIVGHMHPCSKLVSQIITNDLVSNVEYGIGHYGSWASFRAFDSYACMHATWAAQNGLSADGRPYEVVIPNLYDVDEFPEGPGGDYLAIVAHLGKPKGLDIAINIARHTGRKLIAGGPGLVRQADGNYLGEEGIVYDISGVNFEYVGHVDQQQRAKLMGGALAVLCPSRYIEPLCGVAIESQLYGTPVIASDWGGMVDTVVEWETGFRCRVPDQWVKAVINVWMLSRQAIRRRAIAKYSLSAVGRMYEEFFGYIQDRWISLNNWETIRRSSLARLV